MSRFVFVTWNGGGNLPPALGIARVLAEHGHEVTFLGSGTQRTRIEGAGISFTPFSQRAEVDAAAPRAPAERLASLVSTVWMNSDLADDVLALLAREPADLVVVDYMLVGVLARSADFDAPTAVLAHSLFERVRPLRDSLLAMGNQQRLAAGGAALDPQAMLWERKDLVVVTTLPEFDGCMGDSGPRVRYVGPVFEWPPLPVGWQLPWHADDPRPLVLATASTTPGQDSPVALQLVFDALADLPVHVLATSGAVSPEALRPPPNAAICGFVPHAAVLPHAALSINQAGHGSVMAALAHGVPSLCLPSVGADQAIIASQVETLGAGKAIRGQPTAGAIRDAVREVINTPR
jgi:UDP:flavonoid glycosyltransferase YjiC (YdhE family)